MDADPRAGVRADDLRVCGNVGGSNCRCRGGLRSRNVDRRPNEAAGGVAGVDAGRCGNHHEHHVLAGRWRSSARRGGAAGRCAKLVRSVDPSRRNHHSHLDRADCGTRGRRLSARARGRRRWRAIRGAAGGIHLCNQHRWCSSRVAGGRLRFHPAAWPSDHVADRQR